MDDSRINPGQAPVERVGGYRVVRRLATGGTSDVLLAKAEGPHGFERTVVLKLLLSQYRSDEQFAKMFAREAAAYARLSHPAIVQLYDFFQLDGQLVMVLEHVDGAPLSRLRGMLKAVGQTIDDKSALFIAQRIFSALSAAHEASGEEGVPTPVIHRDVNPSNVLVPWDGQAKLADFGIARITGVSHESVAGMIKGTYGYMAPEQVDGGAITPRADVYAAGIVLWELLTRRRAFQRGALPEIEVLRAMAEPRITSIDVLRPDVDRNVREALTRALQPRADKRNVTAEEMVAILREVVPPEEGRERLASLLALVRHEPRPAATSVPPPMETTERMPAAKPPLPKPAKPPPPRPPSVSRMTAAYGAPPPVPRRTASGALAAAAPPVPTAGRSPAPGAVSSKTALGMPASSADPPPTESTPQLVSAADDDSAKMRLGTPLQAIAPGLTLKDAIDEILSGVPSSIPPSVLSSREPSTPPETARMMGHIPPAPAPLNVTVPLAGAAPPRPHAPPPDEMPELAKTIQELERAEQPTVRPSPVGKEASPPPSPALDRTLALDHRVATAPMPAFHPPPGAPPPPQLPPPISSPPAPSTGTYDAIPARARSSRGGLVALLVATALAAGVAGTFGFIHYQRAKTGAPLHSSTTSAVAKPPPTTTAAPFVPPASASAAPSAPVSASEPVPAPSASAPASAAPSASASATPSSAPSSAPSPSEIPPGMGVLKTAGAAPNRRIFVDERTLGQTPESVTVKCGTHTVRLGSAGHNQTVDVPCGGEITVGDR